MVELTCSILHEGCLGQIVTSSLKWLTRDAWSTGVIVKVTLVYNLERSISHSTMQYRMMCTYSYNIDYDVFEVTHVHHR